MPKLFKHRKTGVLVWANSDNFGSQWEVITGCWLDELPRPFQDDYEKRKWHEDSILYKGRRTGPILSPAGTDSYYEADRTIDSLPEYTENEIPQM